MFVRFSFLVLFLFHLQVFSEESYPIHEQLYSEMTDGKSGNKNEKKLLSKLKDVNLRIPSGQTCLSRAAYLGNLEMVKLLVEKGGFVNETNVKLSMPPLHEACGPESNLGVVQYLVSKGADVNSRGYYGHTALHEAASYGKLEIVKFLIQNKANPNSLNNTKESPLHFAISGKHLQVAKYLLENGIDFDSNLHESYLCAGSLSGLAEIVRILINKKLSVNVLCKNNFTPIYLSVLGGNLEVAKLLLGARADVNFKSSEYSTSPIELAAQDKDKRFYNLFSFYNKKPSFALHNAAETGNWKLVKEILEKGENVNLKNSSGQTALHLACISDSIDTIQYLIDKGSDVNLADQNGNTPLFFCAMDTNFNDPKKARLLISKGANINTSNKKGQSVLHYAASYSNFGLVQYLIEKGLSPNLQDYEGNTSLHWLSNGTIGWIRAKEIVEFLSEKGVNFHTKNKKGQTALVLARVKRNQEIVSILEKY